mgnify:CR=1 FL=1
MRPVPPDLSVDPDTRAWLDALGTTGPQQDAAISRLHDLMRRAAGRYLSGQAAAASLGHVRREEIIQSTADEATVDVINALATFEGRSRFTTWAYKFAIVKAAVEVRRATWRPGEVGLDAAGDPQDSALSPHEHAEAAALSAAIRTGIDTVLTAHQRRVLVAIVIDAVPIDVLADRLDTNRNALYKTLHDARKRLRAELVRQGLIDAARKEVTA